VAAVAGLPVLFLLVARAVVAIVVQFKVLKAFLVKAILAVLE